MDDPRSDVCVAIVRTMGYQPKIDTTFDFRADTPVGRDPDQSSPTLRGYHKLLWSKPLPSGMIFELNDATKGSYLYYKSTLREFFLSSDSVIPTYANWKRPTLSRILAQIPQTEIEHFQHLGYTIGGMMLFPGRRIDRGMTINQARGIHPRIADRLDLTVECIRRHYLVQSSPLADALARYSDFFALFGGFRGYVDFFLLQDLTTEDYLSVRFFLPFEGFGTPALPRNVDEYKEYRHRSIDFVEARNRRIAASCE